MLEPYLDSTCATKSICRNRACPEVVKQNPATGRFFITMGHSGFNSRANNHGGYVSASAARTAFNMYASRGETQDA